MLLPHSIFSFLREDSVLRGELKHSQRARRLVIWVGVWFGLFGLCFITETFEDLYPFLHRVGFWFACAAVGWIFALPFFWFRRKQDGQRATTPRQRWGKKLWVLILILLFAMVIFKSELDRLGLLGQFLFHGTWLAAILWPVKMVMERPADYADDIIVCDNRYCQYPQPANQYRQKQKPDGNAEFYCSKCKQPQSDNNAVQIRKHLHKPSAKAVSD